VEAARSRQGSGRYRGFATAASVGRNSAAHSPLSASMRVLPRCRIIASIGSRRNLLLYRKPAGLALEPIGGEYRRAARCGSPSAGPRTFSHRRLGRWRAIKTGFAKSLPIAEPRSPVMTRRGERGIWQRRYWEHTISDARDNPVKHGLVAHPADWPHSSFLRCVAGGIIPPTGGRQR